MSPPSSVLVLHGGAGAIAIEGLDRGAALASLRQALDRGLDVLGRGGAALDAVEVAVRVLEDSGRFNAGRGAAPDAAGGVSLDAALMDGATSRAGGVAALTGFANPIAIARLVLERTPHVLLAGPGAEAFAAAQGLPRVPDAYFTRRTGATADVAVPSPGTVGAVALDRDGRLAAATSTGGVTGKLPGRVGDSPIVGAGTYADDRCAVSATGAGEFFVRTVFAHRVAVAVSAGVPVAQATQRALDGVTSLGGSGGCVAVDASGAIAMPFSTVGMFRAVGDAGGGREGAIFGEALAAI